MPTYCFECVKCKLQWEDVFRMADEKISKCKKCKKVGNRVFTSPQANIDTKVNPHDLDALTAKTGKMKGTIGDLWDIAAEASEKRGGDNDPIKKKALENYAKQRKGKQYKSKPKSSSLDIQFKTKS